MSTSTSLSARCQKFQPNIFNKTKCQNCFKPKEQHSTDAIDSSKITRKISKCGYLFVAPDTYDFSNAMDRSRRWQRRFFVLYDDGELTYSVDENVNTIPQCAINMAAVSDICDAEDTTTHQLSVAIITPDNVFYVKGTTKDEIGRWHDVLAMYQRSNKIKHRRSPTYLPPTTDLAKPLVNNVKVEPEVAETSADTAAAAAAAPSAAPTPLSRSAGRVWRDRSVSPAASWSSGLHEPGSWPASGTDESGQPDLHSDVRANGSPNEHLHSLNGRNKNETDEHKMAKSGESNTSSRTTNHSRAIGHSNREGSPDLYYTKKGWLVKQGATSKDSSKHWFVLSGATLRYYGDACAEERGAVDGHIDVSCCDRVTETNVTRYYGFKLESEAGDTVLSAMTTGIRAKWMQALTECLASVAAQKTRAMTAGVGDTTVIVRPASSVQSKSLTDSASASSSSRSSRSGSVDKTGFTCTWPYRKIESPPVVQVSPEPDVVEPSGRRILRRAVTDSLPPPPPHHRAGLEAVDAAQLSPAARRRRDSREHRARSMSVPLVVDALHAAGAATTAAGEGVPEAKFRAPSARLREKSRCKSPRSRSPPPATKTPAPTTEQGVPPITNESVPNNSQSNGLMELRQLETELSGLRTRLTDAESELRNVKQTNAQLTAQVAAQSAEHEVQQAELAVLRVSEEDDADAQQVAAAGEELARLRQQLAVMATELSTVKTSMDVAASSHEFKVDELRAAAVVAGRDLADLQRHLVERAEALAKSKTAARSLEAELSRLSESHEARLKEVERSGEAELSRLAGGHTAELQQLRAGQEAESREASDRREAELAAVRAAGRAAGERTAALEAARSDADEMITQLETRLIEGATSVERLSDELSLEMEDSATLRRRLAAADAALGETRTAQREAERQREAAGKRAGAAEAEAGRLEEELRAGGGTGGAWGARRPSNAATVSRLKQEWAATEVSYEEQIGELRARTHDLTAKLTAAEKRVRRLDRRSSARYQSTGSEPECDTGKADKLTSEVSVWQHAARTAQLECESLRRAERDDPRLGEALGRLRRAHARIDACREALAGVAVGLGGRAGGGVRAGVDGALAVLDATQDAEAWRCEAAAGRLAMEAAVQDAMAREAGTTPRAAALLQRLQLASYHLLRLSQRLGDGTHDADDDGLETRAALIADRMQRQQQLADALRDTATTPALPLAPPPGADVDAAALTLLKAGLDDQMGSGPALAVSSRAVVQRELSALWVHMTGCPDSGRLAALQHSLAAREERALHAVEEFRATKITEISEGIVGGMANAAPDRTAGVRDAIQRDGSAGEFAAVLTHYVAVWEGSGDGGTDDVATQRQHHLLHEMAEEESRRFSDDLLEQCLRTKAPLLVGEDGVASGALLDLAAVVSLKVIVATILTCVNEEMKGLDLRGAGAVASEAAPGGEARRQTAAALAAGNVRSPAARLAVRLAADDTRLDTEATYQAQLAYAAFCAADGHRRHLEDERQAADDERSCLSEHHARQLADLEATAAAQRRTMDESRSRIAELASQLSDAQRDLQRRDAKSDDAAATAWMVAPPVSRRRSRVKGSPDTPPDPPGEKALNIRLEQMQEQIQNMQADYEHELCILKEAHRRELACSKDDMMTLLTAADESNVHLNEEVIRKRYMKEVDKIKLLYDKGFTTMEKSHQKVLTEVHQAHRREMDVLRQEKDLLLQEETRATQSALDAMRKAHEAELQGERNKFLDVITKTYSKADVESLQKLHEEDLAVIQSDMSHLSEQYSLQAMESASLEERLQVQTKVLHQSRCRVQDLISRNEELNTTLRHEIGRLNRMMQRDAGSSGSLEMAEKIKDAEIQQLTGEVSSWREQLQDTVQELGASMELYHDLYTEHTQLKQRYELDVVEMRERLQSPGETRQDDGPHGDESAASDSMTLDVSDSQSRSRCSAAAGKVNTRTSWRTKKPERARSSLGLMGAVGGRETGSDTETTEATPGGRHRNSRNRFRTTLGINVIEEL